MLNKILTAILSLLIAIALWVYVVTVVSPGSENTYSDIPVVLQSEGILQERGLMITTEHTPTVDLRLSGNRSDLNKLNIANIVVTVDVSKITEPGVHQLSYDVNFPGDVANNAITTEHRDPDYVALTVQRKITKPVPVRVSFTGAVDKDYLADKENYELDNREVMVTGPQDVIDQIAMARIEVDLEDRKDSFSEAFEYTLCNAEGRPIDVHMVTTNLAEVNLTMRIQMMKKVPVTLNVVAGGGATEQTCSIKMDQKVIVVSGSETALKDLEKIELGTVDLGTILEDTTMKFPVVLPEGVNNETGAGEVTVTIQFPDLRTKVLNVSNITAINVPEGMEPEIITKALEVRFRGPKALIDELSAEAVTVTVDFSQGQVGTATMHVTVSLAEEYTEVGILGSYSVSATLRVLEPDPTEDGKEETQNG